MPTVRLPNGQTAAFPEGMSPDDIQKAIESDPNSGAHIETQGTLSAAPAPSWGSDLENDLRQGGSRTVVGRFLGKMQGRGEQGYSGLESGVTPAVANYVGSPELGAAHMISGAQEIPSHPLTGAMHVAGGAIQAATLPLTFAGGPVSEAGMNLMPSRSAAADALNMIQQRAEQQPVVLSRSQEALQRLAELGTRGGTMPRAADQLLNRSQSIVPLNFPEARDFYSNVSRVSGEEANKMTPTVAREMGNLRAAMHGDLTDAAEGVGMGPQYNAAVREYGRASEASKATRTVGKYLVRIGGAGVAGDLAYHYLNRK